MADPRLIGRTVIGKIVFIVTDDGHAQMEVKGLAVLQVINILTNTARKLKTTDQAKTESNLIVPVGCL